jgi:hypothetical protein
MNQLLRLLVILIAVLFVVMGLRWVADPASAASALGMSLMDGEGRSAQIGDVGALFLSLGMMILLGLITAKRSWFYAPALMLYLVALLRVLAWLLHDAALVMAMILLEIVVASILVVAAPRLAQDD